LLTMFDELVQIGDTLTKQGNLLEAAEIYKQAIESNPHETGSYYKLGLVLSGLDELDSAVTQFRKAIELDPGNPVILNNFGSVLFKQQKMDEAELLLQDALKIRPDYSGAFYNLGRVYLTSDKPIAAIKAFEDCIQSDPFHNAAKIALAECKKNISRDRLTHLYKKILIVMEEGIGNMIMLTPALKALKRMLPESHITVYGRQPSVQVIEDWEIVDSIIEKPGDEHFDICFLTIWARQFATNSEAWLKKSCKSVIKLGLNPEQHEADSCFQMAHLFGYDEQKKPDSFCNSCDVKLKLPKKGKIIALSDTALDNETWERKRWPYYKDLAGQLINRGNTVLLIGGPEEANRFRPEEWPFQIINCLGKYTVQETAGLLQKCDIFIGNDSGPAHMAAALGIRTIVLFGPTLISKNIPLGRDVQALRLDMECSPCQYTGRWKKCVDWKCLKALTVDYILPAVFQRENPKESDGTIIIKTDSSLKLCGKDYSDCRVIKENYLTWLVKGNVKEQLRIHLVGARRANFPWGMENEIYRTIEIEGIDIIETDYRLDRRNFTDLFLREAHLMLVCKGSGIPPELIKRFPGRTLLWYQDDIFSTTHASRDLEFNGWAFDVVYSFDKCALDEYRKYKITDVKYLPLAMSPVVHRKMFLPKKYDVAFVGNIHPNRRPFLERLQKRYNILVKRAFMDEMVSIFNQSRIVLNLGIGPTGIQQRVFEVLGCGSFLMTNEIPEESRLFLDKEHLVYFKEETIEDQIAYYLAEDQERETIASQGYLEVHTNHTFQHRITEILGSIFGKMV